MNNKMIKLYHWFMTLHPLGTGTIETTKLTDTEVTKVENAENDVNHTLKVHPSGRKSRTVSLKLEKLKKQKKKKK